MARLWQSGFELNSTTNGVEFGATLNSPTIVTSPVRSGTYAGKITSLVSATQKYFQYTVAAANANGPFFVSFYIYFDTFPSAANTCFALTAANGTNIGIIKVDNTGAFSLFNGASQVGSASSTITIQTWHKLDMWFDNSPAGGSQILKAQLDNVQFAASTILTIGTGIQTANWGGNVNSEAQTTGTWYFDDLKINDSTGSNENTYPGSGKIIHLKPSAAGDINGFTVAVGGTAGSANNFTRVQENTPDDATSYNGAALLNAEDLFNVDNFTGGAFSSINVVAVGVRMADLVAGDATTGVKLEIEKTALGTKTQSANLIPNSTSFQTNATADPKSYNLVTYNDPDGVPWGQGTLDSMQIGYINDTVGVQTIAISTVWASVDFTPVSYGTSTSTSSTSSTSSSTSSTSTSISSISTSSTSTSYSSTSTSLSTSSTSLSTSSTSSSISSTSSSTSSTSTSSTSSSTSVSSTSSSISSTSQSSTSQSSTSSSTSYSSISTSFSSTSSSISSTSVSTSSTSFSSTSSSSSTSTTAIPLNLDYSYQDTLTLPSTGADDIDIDTNKNDQNVAVDDGDYFIQYGSEYMIEEYKKTWINNTDTPSFTWKGRSTYDTRISPILIQIYNVNSASWETLANINTLPADTDFQQSVTRTTNVSNYYSSNNVVTFRVYQKVI